MKILGIDFTSRPSKRKPIACVECAFENDALRAQSFQKWSSYDEFEIALSQPGLWIAGLDFPFGQSRLFLENIGWPLSWPVYVRHSRDLGRVRFRDELLAYKQNRAAGDKEHRRLTDIAAGSISPQKLYGVPVGLMFFEGATRLLKAGVSIPHVQEGDDTRIAVEAYPGLLARRLIGRRSYKNDTRKKQTADQHEARRTLLQTLCEESFRRYGFNIVAPDHLCDDPGGDQLDALLCAVQAAWAWRHRRDRFGAPETVDSVEGWIADPHIRA